MHRPCRHKKYKMSFSSVGLFVVLLLCSVLCFSIIEATGNHVSSIAVGYEGGDDSEEEYDFEYSDDEEEETDVDLENRYYSAKALKTEDPRAAVEAFREVIEREEEQGIWGFKATKQTMKLLFAMAQYDEFSQCYTKLLGYTRGAVTQNVGEKGVNSVLDYVSSSNDWDLLKSFYEQTLDTLREHKNNRLWFKCNLKLGHLMYEVGDMNRLQRIIKELLRACASEGEGEEDGPNAVKRGTQLVEICALQILMHSQQRDQKKLREVYLRAVRMTSAVPHPRTFARILECGGKMHMQEREWDHACSAFFQSFKNYDEAGDPERLQVLKYLVMASILHESKIDPFDSQEAKPYKQDPEIVAMTNLVAAFRNKQMKEFERILKTHHTSLMGDPFIKLYMDDILRTMRTQVLLKAIAPYTRVTLPHVASELNGIPVAEVENLLVSLILDGKVDGKIDQVNQVLLCGTAPAHTSGAGGRKALAGDPSAGSGLVLGPPSRRAAATRTAVALGRWADSLSSLEARIAAKVEFR